MSATGTAKKFIAAMAASVTMSLSSAPAYAGIPVIDAAALVEAIKSTIAWGQQASDMIETITQMRQTVAGITNMTSKIEGIRNLGTILDNPSIGDLLPPAMRDVTALLVNPNVYSANPAAIAGVLTSFGVNVPAGTVEAATGVADAIVRSRAIMQSGQARTVQLGALAARVNSAIDLKDSSDLISRNVLENSQILNSLFIQMAAKDYAEAQATLRDMAAAQVERARVRAIQAATLYIPPAIP